MTLSSWPEHYLLQAWTPGAHKLSKYWGKHTVTGPRRLQRGKLASLHSKSTEQPSLGPQEPKHRRPDVGPSKWFPWNSINMFPFLPCEHSPAAPLTAPRQNLRQETAWSWERRGCRSPEPVCSPPAPSPVTQCQRWKHQWGWQDRPARLPPVPGSQTFWNDPRYLVRCQRTEKSACSQQSCLGTRGTGSMGVCKFLINVFAKSLYYYCNLNSCLYQVK